MTSNEYSLKQAEKLVTFYKPKLIGRILEESLEYQITDVITQTVNDIDYRVIAVATVGVIRHKRDVASITSMHNLPSPEEILSAQG
jgi:hypothetical protein